MITEKWRNTKVRSDYCIMSRCEWRGTLCDPSPGAEFKFCPKLQNPDEHIRRELRRRGIPNIREEVGDMRVLVNPDEYPRFENPDGSHFPMFPKWRKRTGLWVRELTEREAIEAIRAYDEGRTIEPEYMPTEKEWLQGVRTGTDKQAQLIKEGRK